MISSNTLAELPESVKKITGLDVMIADEKGVITTGTRAAEVEEEKNIAAFALSEKESFEEKGYFLLRDRYESADVGFVVALFGEGGDKDMIARMVSLQVKQIIRGNESRTPVNDLLSNLLLDNILHTNIESEAAYLGMDPGALRRIYIAQAAEGKESALLTKARNAFAGNEKIYVVSVERGRTAIIAEGRDAENAEKNAENIYGRLGGEKGGVVRVAYGLPTDNLEELIFSYRQAITALEVAEQFLQDEIFVSYDKLGPGRLINTLPENVCSAFINENFEAGEIDSIDEEILYTVEVFFDNSLNISETARKMFIHRNTLIYRINKLYNQIGLDVRNFEDALTFKLASMVNKRCKALQGK